MKNKRRHPQNSAVRPARRSLIAILHSALLLFLLFLLCSCSRYSISTQDLSNKAFRGTYKETSNECFNYSDVVSLECYSREMDTLWLQINDNTYFEITLMDSQQVRINVPSASLCNKVLSGKSLKHFGKNVQVPLNEILSIGIYSEFPRTSKQPLLIHRRSRIWMYITAAIVCASIYVIHPI